MDDERRCAVTGGEERVSEKRGAVAQSPSAEQIYGYARRAIRDAAAQLWRGQTVELRDQVPSVTSYVCRVDIANQPVYAKVSILGVSLVSILRGTRGSWREVRAAQQRYQHTSYNLAIREAAHLNFLAGFDRPRVARTVGYSRGVLFTSQVDGQSLSEIALSRFEDLPELLLQTWRELTNLHQTSRRVTSIAKDRDIYSTFIRKFGTEYSVGWLSSIDQDLASTFLSIVTRLRPFRAPVMSDARPIFGDLKPEHVLVSASGELTLLDPGLAHRPVVVDAAKLISRLLLDLLSSCPNSERTYAVVGAVEEFAYGCAAEVAAYDRKTWWRDLVVLWLQDTLNILSTWLAAPSDLLPPLSISLTAYAMRVCTVAERIMTTLSGTRNPQAAWRRGIAEVLAG